MTLIETGEEELMDHVDVLIVGAGLSGIGAAVHLQQNSPGKTYAILEGRETLGGTWDLFRYPGIRSDSDMHTLGYAFKPWTEAKAIADGPNILNYIHETAAEHGILDHIQFNSMVKGASWNSETATWTVEISDAKTDKLRKITCGFLFMCSGYYDYEGGYMPDFDGVSNFKGRVVHPQNWTDDIDYAGKKVIVIGSGATAVTLVPEMAKTASHVVMLQRSPTYIVSAPAKDRIANFMNKYLPEKLAYFLTRWRKISIQLLFFKLIRARPEKMKQFFIKQIREEIGDVCDVDTHFTPSYAPWDQRLCLVPDSDLFGAIKNGSASVVTDHIDHFTENGILLKSGKELEADLVVSATGLKLKVFGGIALSVDGEPVELSSTMNYKGAMFSGIPNFVSIFGYTNASWTLKADLVSEFVCRLLNHLEKTGTDYCVPRQNDASVEEEPWLDFSSGYIQRSIHLFPKQGSKKPWRLNQNYARDLMLLRHHRLDDGVLAFERAGKTASKNKAA